MGSPMPNISDRLCNSAEQNYTADYLDGGETIMETTLQIASAATK